ncbi:polyprenyl synthetase family protein [Streptomyces zingiberis]|uniref:Polyprenyl synthetase family protein n=1 Tax=Streptomyces zingiberis TaxID=2053010 RepID=A0ABX1C103_9ACTN|nr:polyprenyl synthetase family protein [Streptomyces zingiberis]NJQ03599.1 polyprenyl synthetase family protein [Streptomyces zingiberis]
MPEPGAPAAVLVTAAPPAGLPAGVPAGGAEGHERDAAVSRAVRRAREEVRPALREWTALLGPELATLCGYQMGLCDADGLPIADPAPGAGGAGGRTPAPGPGAGAGAAPGAASSGKLVRPALALASAAAVGAKPEVALPGAVATELVHNFSLLHDDVMDGDRVRRHRPSAWVRFGTPLTILAGDGLLALAFEVLSSQPAPGPADLTADLSVALRRLCLGQGQDLLAAARRGPAGAAGETGQGTEREPGRAAEPAATEADLDACLRMLEAKTGALLGFACRAGAAYAGAPPAALEAFERFGSRLGLAFQLQDDLLGIWGRPADTGKPARSDLRERKRSAPVVAALASGTPAGRRLAALYARPEPLTEDEIPYAATLVEEAGGRERTLAEARRRQEEAWRSLSELGPPLVDPAGLREVVDSLTGRSS